VRAELLGVELEEGNARRKRLLVLGGVAVLFGAVTLQLVALLVLALFWDTHRVAAAVGVTIVYGGVAAWAFAAFREIARNTPPPFSATLAEFRKDLEMLRGSDDPPD
jgi:uncharacterized membrane protein YqjE